MKWWMLCFWIITTSPVWAQKIVKVNQATGVVTLHGDLSLNRAKEKAIQEAKLDALRQAGVGEQISETSMLFQQSTTEKADALFSSLISNQINGEIAGFEVLSEGVKNNYEQPVYEVVIRAEVKVYDQEETSGIQVELSGIRDQYFDQEALQFSVQSNRDGYLHAYIVTESEVYQIFPNAYEKSHAIVGGKAIQFPINTGIDYKLEITKPEAIHYLVLLFTTEAVKLSPPSTLNELLSRLAGLPRKQKTVEWHSFIVRKKG
jgi:hypothetical protein